MTIGISDQKYLDFLEQLKKQVINSRYQAVRMVNRELILLYYQIGVQIIKRQSLYGWGSKVINQLSRDLLLAFPKMKGFSVRNLKYMRLFAETYSDFEFVQDVLAQLPWYQNIT